MIGNKYNWQCGRQQSCEVDCLHMWEYKANQQPACNINWVLHGPHKRLWPSGKDGTMSMLFTYRVVDVTPIRLSYHAAALGSSTRGEPVVTVCTTACACSQAESVVPNGEAGCPHDDAANGLALQPNLGQSKMGLPRVAH